MGNIAYYLKYRPQTLSELIGQEAVKKTLLNSLQNDKLSHAYLFVGPRGTGKTSTARILAKMVNCEKAISYSPLAASNQKANSQQPIANSELPCNKCDLCISVTDGSNMDLIEIDAASNRGIEDIRLLREKIKLAPTNAKKKVYIIDEVHMLTMEAFNALLKTLEEPPAHALFILATTEISKVPQTILSRVQRLDFKLALQDEIIEALKNIITKEKIEIEDEALKLLVKKSEGSFRDAVKLLDQAASLGEKITTKSLAENLKSGEFESILSLVQVLQKKDSALGLLETTKQLASGIDTKELTLSLMDVFRNLNFIKNEVGEQLVKIHLTEEKYNQLVEISKGFTKEDLVRNLNILQEALEKLKFASIASLPLELAVVEICSKNVELRIQNVELKESEDKPVILTPDLIRGKDLKIKEESLDSSPTALAGAQNDNLELNTTNAPESSDILKLKEKWTFVLETIRPYNFSLEALLRSINVVECSQSTVKMEVPYSFHQRILEAPKNRDLLESILSDILGRSVRIAISLGVRPKRKEDIANIELAADDEIIRAAAEIFNSDTVN